LLLALSIYIYQALKGIEEGKARMGEGGHDEEVASSENRNRAKLDTLFMTKTAENHTLWGRTYLYSPYKGVPPRGRTPRRELSRLGKLVYIKIN